VTQVRASRKANKWRKASLIYYRPSRTRPANLEKVCPRTSRANTKMISITSLEIFFISLRSRHKSLVYGRKLANRIKITEGGGNSTEFSSNDVHSRQGQIYLRQGQIMINRGPSGEKNLISFQVKRFINNRLIKRTSHDKSLI